MKIGFVTTNRHKVAQAKKILADFEIDHIDEGYDEPSDDDNITIVKKAAKMLCEKHGRPIMVEDTSFFFDAYPGFPGSLAKFVFQKIGYDGIFRLMKGKDDKGHFSSAIGYCEPGKEPIVIEETMQGRVISEVVNPEKDVLPYTRIFVPEGFSNTMSEISDEELFPIMHRAKALKKLAEQLEDRK